MFILSTNRWVKVFPGLYQPMNLRMRDKSKYDETPFQMVGGPTGNEAIPEIHKKREFSYKNSI